MFYFLLTNVIMFLLRHVGIFLLVYIKWEESVFRKILLKFISTSNVIVDF